MAGLSDEMLMAYADGVLDAADRAAVEAVVQHHPEYQAKIARFRATLAPVRQAFAEERALGDLSRLAAKIRRERWGPNVAGRGAGLRVLRETGRRARPLWPAAMAASLALLIGGGLGWVTRGVMPWHPVASPSLVAFHDGDLVAEGPFGAVLEGAKSGAGSGDGVAGPRWQLKVSFSFRSVAGEHCRRYEISNDAAGRFAGFACRSSAGQWIVQGQQRLGRKPSSGGYFPVDREEQDLAVDTAIRAVMDGDVLSTSEEAELIASRWSTNK